MEVRGREGGVHANVNVGVSPVIGVAAATRLARAHPHGQLVLEALEQPVERVGAHHQRAQPHVDEGEREREHHREHAEEQVQVEGARRALARVREAGEHDDHLGQQDVH